MFKETKISKRNRNDLNKIGDYPIKVLGLI